ncbi:MAG: biotin transporter BioY [Roseburia sp.]
MDFVAALAVGVFPFIIEDLIKIIFAAVVAPQIYKRLVIANVL